LDSGANRPTIHALELLNGSAHATRITRRIPSRPMARPVWPYAGGDRLAGYPNNHRGRHGAIKGVSRALMMGRCTYERRLMKWFDRSFTAQFPSLGIAARCIPGEMICGSKSSSGVL